jgi:hypothetical protein
MEGQTQEGWYNHPSLGLIKILKKGNNWYYQCYNTKGTKSLSKEKPLDQWTWALSEARDS